ncbi:MAG: EVE domain-containing protein [Myxococcaceae bacterium]
MRFWLMKSEPDVFSIDDLARERTTGWEGVRNYEARNIMRDLMKPGDQVLFYHSNAKPSGVAGLAKVDGLPIPDPTQFDRRSPYYDAASTAAAPRWQMVRIAFVQRFRDVLPLERLKAHKALEGMALLRKGQRLSVQAVQPKHFRAVLKLANADR